MGPDYVFWGVWGLWHLRAGERRSGLIRPAWLDQLCIFEQRSAAEARDNVVIFCPNVSFVLSDGFPKSKSITWGLLLPVPDLLVRQQFSELEQYRVWPRYLLIVPAI